MPKLLRRVPGMPRTLSPGMNRNNKNGSFLGRKPWALAHGASLYFSLSALLLTYCFIVLPTLEYQPTVEDSLAYLYAGRHLASGQGLVFDDENNAKIGPYFSLHGYQVRQPDQPNRLFLSYPIGFPLLVAGAQTVANGSRHLNLTFFSQTLQLEFLVVPLLGLVAVVITVLLGKLLASWQVGVSAALILTLAPTFLLFTTSFWSDVPSMAFLWLGIFLYVLFLRSEPSKNRVLVGILGIAAGLILGYSFFIRYTNLAILLPLMVSLLFVRQNFPQKSFWPMAATLTLAVAGLLLFNRYFYGGFLITGYSPQHNWYPWPPFQLGYALGDSPFGGRSLLGALETLILNFHFALPFALFGFFKLPQKLKILAILFTGAFLGLFSIYFFPPVNINSRFLLPLFPLISLAAGFGLEQIGRLLPKYLTYLTITGLTLVYLASLTSTAKLLNQRNLLSADKVSLIQTITAPTPPASVFIAYQLNDLIITDGNRSGLNYRHLPTADPVEKSYQLEELEPKLVAAVSKLLEQKKPVYYIQDTDPPFWNSLQILQNHFSLTPVQSSPPVYQLTRP